MSYNAVIAKLENVRKHSNADRLNIATCMGYQVIVGIDSRDGDVVVLFPDDGQLSDEYAKANDLVGYTDSKGEKKGGYFDKSRRVRAQTFRGEKSEAYVADLVSLVFADPNVGRLPLGTQFNELNGIPICNKYVTPETKALATTQTKSANPYSAVKMLFPEHFDTAQYRFARDDQKVGLVIITAKLHGTSQRSCLQKVRVVHPQAWWQKLLRLPHKVTEEWHSLYGTRRVIKGQVTKAVDFRTACHNRLAPHIKKGEVWYYEIVGYEDAGKTIMPAASLDKMDKPFRKRFGKGPMVYKYGCAPGTCTLYVYRIAVVGEDGEQYELPWGVVKDRCKKAGVKHVPELEIFTSDTPGFVDRRVEHWTDLQDIAEPLDLSHVREGVCVRVENLSTGKVAIWKNKTFEFKVLEGIIKDTGVVDLEEVEACC